MFLAAPPGTGGAELCASRRGALKELRAQGSVRLVRFPRTTRPGMTKVSDVAAALGYKNRSGRART
jgi:hypothetical protein